MKITIEKDNYDHTTESFKTTTIVYETNEVSLFESFQIINKAFSIVAVNGKYDFAKELCPGSNPWVPHQCYLDCRTEAIARNAVRILRRQFPGKSYRFKPSRWTDAKGNRFPSTS